MPELAEYTMKLIGPWRDLEEAKARLAAGLYPPAGVGGDFFCELPPALWGPLIDGHRLRHWLAPTRDKFYLPRRPDLSIERGVLTARGVCDCVPPLCLAERITEIWPHVLADLCATIGHLEFHHFQCVEGRSRRVRGHDSWRCRPESPCDACRFGEGGCDGMCYEFFGDENCPDPLSAWHREAVAVGEAELGRLRGLLPQDVEAARDDRLREWAEREKGRDDRTGPAEQFYFVVSGVDPHALGAALPAIAAAAYPEPARVVLGTVRGPALAVHLDTPAGSSLVPVMERIRADFPEARFAADLRVPVPVDPVSEAAWAVVSLDGGNE
jgi:hypothetical protein